MVPIGRCSTRGLALLEEEAAAEEAEEEEKDGEKRREVVVFGTHGAMEGIFLSFTFDCYIRWDRDSIRSH